MKGRALSPGSDAHPDPRGAPRCRPEEQPLTALAFFCRSTIWDSRCVISSCWRAASSVFLASSSEMLAICTLASPLTKKQPSRGEVRQPPVHTKREWVLGGLDQGKHLCAEMGVRGGGEDGEPRGHRKKGRGVPVVLDGEAKQATPRAPSATRRDLAPSCGSRAHGDPGCLPRANEEAPRASHEVPHPYQGASGQNPLSTPSNKSIYSQELLSALLWKGNPVVHSAVPLAVSHPQAEPQLIFLGLNTGCVSFI